MQAWPFLAMILFLPWFAVLGGIYLWITHRRRLRISLDLALLLLATVASFWAMHWGFMSADRAYGTMWPQVFATLMAYAAFLLVLGVALPLRLLGTSRDG